MRKVRFDERLNVVIDKAVHRLYERMNRAYFHGRLQEYMTKIQLPMDMEPNEELDVARFRQIREEMGKRLSLQIQRARKNGYLKDYLAKINMLDILLAPRHVRTVRLEAAYSSQLRSRNLPLEGETDDFIARRSRFTRIK